jgi:hypothetical protein
MAAADRHRARGDNEHFLPTLTARRHVVDQRGEPVAPQLATGFVDQ